MIVHNNIVYEKLSFLEQFYDDPTRGVPNASGVYYWVYWPDFDINKTNTIDLSNHLAEFSSKSLQFEENMRGRYKFEVRVREQRFERNGQPFGLTPSKFKRLQSYLTDKGNLIVFNEFFKEICFARPFYVGKAENLQYRLRSHFKSKSSILPQIQSQNVPFSEVWVGYKLIPAFGGEKINEILEEIMSRNIKPGLTIKPN